MLLRLGTPIILFEPSVNSILSSIETITLKSFPPVASIPNTSSIWDTRVLLTGAHNTFGVEIPPQVSWAVSYGIFSVYPKWISLKGRHGTLLKENICLEEIETNHLGKIRSNIITSYRVTQQLNGSGRNTFQQPKAQYLHSIRGIKHA